MRDKESVLALSKSCVWATGVWLFGPEKQVTNYFSEVRDFSIQTPFESESRVTPSDTRGGSEITMNLTGSP